MSGQGAEVDAVLRSLSDGLAAVLIADAPQGSCIICDASLVNLNAVNLMALHGRGLICHAMSAAQMLRLGLQLLPTNNARGRAWQFGVSIEAASGVSTGISAADRALTLRTAALPTTRPSDLSTPGHVIPVVAGFTEVFGVPEAAIRLTRSAGHSGGAAICTILDDNGDVADRPVARALAERLGLPCVEIETVAQMPALNATFRRVEIK